VPLVRGQAAVSVGVGEAHSCALLASGDVQCWGAGSNGRLGYGNSNSLGATSGATADSGGAVMLASSGKARSIAVGRTHTCAVLSDSALNCWGGNNQGQLGIGSTTSVGESGTPASSSFVSFAGNYLVRQIALGVEHSCAVFSAGGV